jgi:ABC-type lipoprotein release transport system permease subunit
VDLASRAERMRAVESSAFDKRDLQQGLVLNAAILLKDPAKIRETMAEIGQVNEAQALKLQIVDWQTASGIVGQFIVLVRGVLYIIIGITFLVALVIINNSMIMATMERVTEIGTMRAIGAQRPFVMGMFLIETIVLGVLSGGLGALLGAGMVKFLGINGIRAINDVFIFLFSGRRLHPTVEPQHLIFGLVIIMIVSLISTLYPGWIAARIQPVVAMQAKE